MLGRAEEDGVENRRRGCRVGVQGVRKQTYNCAGELFEVDMQRCLDSSSTRDNTAAF